MNFRNSIVPLVALAMVLAWGHPSARAGEKIQIIQAVVKTEPWNGWDGGEPLSDAPKTPPEKEKLTRVPPAEGRPQIFAGNIFPEIDELSGSALRA